MSAQNRKSRNTAIRSACPRRLRHTRRSSSAAVTGCAAPPCSSGSAQPRAPACGRARAGCASGRGRPRVARPSARAPHGRRGRLRAGSPHSFSEGGERRTTPKICRLTKAARCAILRLDGRRKFALRRPGIEAYAEISRAFRCVIGSLRPTGRKFQNATHFAPNFVSFFVQFRREPEFSSPGRASRRNCVPPLAEGDRPPRIRCGGAPSCTKSRYYPTNGSTLRHDFSVRKLYNICRKEEQPWNLLKT